MERVRISVRLVAIVIVTVVAYAARFLFSNFEQIFDFSRGIMSPIFFTESTAQLCFPKKTENRILKTEKGALFQKPSQSKRETFEL